MTKRLSLFAEQMKKIHLQIEHTLERIYQKRAQRLNQLAERIEKNDQELAEIEREFTRLKRDWMRKVSRINRDKNHGNYHLRNRKKVSG